MSSAKQFELTNKTITCLHSDVQAEVLNISPKWQRDDVWNNYKKQQLIVSILRQIPIPAIYTYLNEETGQEELLDGKQRLTAIFDFINRSLHIDRKIIKDNDLQEM